MLSVAKRQSFAISCKLWRKHSLFCPFAIRFKTQELLFAGPLWSTAYQLVSHMFDRPAPFLVIFTPKKSLQCWLCARDIIGSLPLGQCSHCFSGTWTSLVFWKDPNIGEPSFKEKPSETHIQTSETSGVWSVLFPMHDIQKNQAFIGKKTDVSKCSWWQPWGLTHSEGGWRWKPLGDPQLPMLKGHEHIWATVNT